VSPTCTCFLIVGGGVTVAGLFVLRHAIRTAAPSPANANRSALLTPRARPSRTHRPLSLRTALKRLRREKNLQRPWEGRN